MAGVEFPAHDLAAAATFPILCHGRNAEIFRPTAQANDNLEYSLLRTGALRPLHVALAERFTHTEPDDPQWNTLLRLYRTLPTEQKTKCRSALVSHFSMQDGTLCVSRP